jgi:RNase H-fold protein (predicted Holliday junction resolvase)
VRPLPAPDVPPQTAPHLEDESPDWRYDDERLPPDGMQEPRWRPMRRAPPLQHGGKTQQAVTRVCSLKKAMNDPAHALQLRELAQFWSIIKGHTFNVLARVAEDFIFEYESAADARAQAAVLNRFCTTATALASGIIFDETIVSKAIQEVIACVGKPPPTAPAEPAERRSTRRAADDAAAGRAPPLRHVVVVAAASYFSDAELCAQVAALSMPALWSYGIIAANRRTIETSFANFYVYANPQLQRRCLREEYDLYGKEAKAVCECVGPADSARLELCVKSRVKAAKAQGHRARERAAALHRAAAEAEAAVAALPAAAAANAADAARKALQDAKAAAADADAAFQKMQEKVDELIKDIKLSDQAALEEEALARLPQRKQRRKPASDEVEEEVEGAPTPLTLREIAEAEMQQVPETMKQYELLLYRKKLQRRLAAAVAPELHSYAIAPRAKPSLQFVHVDHEALNKMLTGFFTGGARVGDNTFQSLLKRLVDEDVRKELLCGRAETGDFGTSFSTNGTEVHFLVVNKATLYAKECKARAAKKGKAAAARGAAVDEPDDLGDVDEALDFSAIDTRVEERKHKAFPEFPEGAIFTALDIGVANIYARATDGYEDAPSPAKGEPFAGRKGRGSADDPGAKLAVLSVRTFNHESGHYARRRTLERDLARKRRDNPDFVAAEAAFRDANTAAPDRDEHLAALQARGKAASELCRFYSTPRRAKARFDASNAERKTMERHVKLLVPSKLHFVIVGDGVFPSSMRGRESGKGAKFQRTLMQTFPDNVYYMDENRTSKMCSTTKRHVPSFPRQRAGLSPDAAPLREQGDVQPARRGQEGPQGRAAAAPRARPHAVLLPGPQRAVEPRHQRGDQHPEELSPPVRARRAAVGVPPQHRPHQPAALARRRLQLRARAWPGGPAPLAVKTNNYKFCKIAVFGLRP